jgi:hypothetical protein
LDLLLDPPEDSAEVLVHYFKCIKTNKALQYSFEMVRQRKRRNEIEGEAGRRSQF